MRRLHLLPLLVAVLAELCSLALLAVSGWYLAACALAGLGLLATFAYPTPSGIVRLLALGRIGAGYGQNVLLHRAALADTTRERLRVYDELAAEGSLPAEDRTIDRLLTEAQDEGERVLRVTSPLVVTVAAVLTSIVVVVVTLPSAAVPLLLGAATMLALPLIPTTVDGGQGSLRAEVLASMDAAPELESLGGSDLLAARVRAQLDALTAVEQRRQRQQTRTSVVAALAASLGFGGVLLCAAAAVGSSLLTVPLVVMVVCLAFGVLERAHALGDVVPHLQRIRGNRARRGGRPLPNPGSPAAVTVTDEGAITVGPDLVVASGSTAAIIAPSGAGKSTLLAAIATAVRDRARPTASAGEESRTLGAPTVALVADDEFLFTGTVASNLRLGEGSGSAESQRSAADLTALLGMFGLGADIAPGTRTGRGGRALSRGETRRIIIARAVLSAPDVLLIDEPDLGLDADTYRTVLRVVRAQLPDATIVYASHAAPPGAALIHRLG